MLTHLDLPDRQVQEGHVVPDLDDRLGADTAHRRTETTVELEHSELVKDGRVDVGEDLVLLDLLGLGRLNPLPVATISPAPPSQTTSRKQLTSSRPWLARSRIG